MMFSSPLSGLPGVDRTGPCLRKDDSYSVRLFGCNATGLAPLPTPIRARARSRGFHRPLPCLKRSNTIIGLISSTVKDIIPFYDSASLAIRRCGGNGIDRTGDGARTTREGVTDSSKEKYKTDSPTRRSDPYLG
jgi:hypothetical protein